MNQEEKDFFAIVGSLMPSNMKMAHAFTRDEYITVVLIFGAGMRFTIDRMSDGHDIPAALTLFNMYFKLFIPFNGVDIPITVAEIFRAELELSGSSLNNVLSHVGLEYSEGRVVTSEGDVLVDFQEGESDDE